MNVCCFPVQGYGERFSSPCRQQVAVPSVMISRAAMLRIHLYDLARSVGWVLGVAFVFEWCKNGNHASAVRHSCTTPTHHLDIAPPPQVIRGDRITESITVPISVPCLQALFDALLRLSYRLSFTLFPALILYIQRTNPVHISKIGVLA